VGSSDSECEVLEDESDSEESEEEEEEGDEAEVVSPVVMADRQRGGGGVN